MASTFYGSHFTLFGGHIDLAVFGSRISVRDCEKFKLICSRGEAMDFNGFNGPGSSSERCWSPWSSLVYELREVEFQEG